ncbi:MAG: FAD-linked oxidase C-terminal domain-containing protein [Phycisphaeraceae bacterium]
MGVTSTVVEAFQAIVGSAGVLHERDALHVYESDGFPIARGLPTLVVFPVSTEQVARCVKAAAAHGLPLIPRGSGTGLAGGAVAFGGGVIVSTSRMTGIESIDVANRVAVAQAGVRNAALSQAVAATPGGTHLHFSPDPSSQAASTVGGNAATNAGGVNTLKHGVTSTHVLGVELVLPDGSIIQTGGGSLYDHVGPDLTGLLCGSEGTLGIITRIWCRLVPRPRHFRTIYAVFDSSYDACKTVADVIADGITPTSMEMMDGAMIRAVEDAFHYGFPTTAQALLLMEIDGIDQVLDEQLARCVALCRDNRATDVQQCADAAKRAELWSARKRAFGAIGRISHSYCTQDACIPRSKLPEAIEHICKLGEDVGMAITNVFHAGDGNVHPIMLFDEDDPEQVQQTLALSERILEYCISLGGTITGEHGVGVEKLHLMHKMFTPDTIGAFQRIKRAFDPDGRINEGKLIPSDRVKIELLRPTAPNIPGGALAAH